MIDLGFAVIIDELIKSAERLSDEGCVVRKYGRTVDGKPFVIAVGVGKGGESLDRLIDGGMQPDPRSTG